MPGACGAAWSIKDVQNRIAAWHAAAIRVIHDLLAGQWGRLGSSTNSFNAQHYAIDHARTLGESRERLQRMHQALLDLLATLSDEQLLNEYSGQQIGWWAKWTTYAHYEQHITELAAFTQRELAPGSDKPG